MACIIKRYVNRKLYDTERGEHVRFGDLAAMIRAGREISVVDVASGRDVTSVTLTRIILATQRSRGIILPATFLHHIIKHGGTWPIAAWDDAEFGQDTAELRTEVAALRERLRSLEAQLPQSAHS
jgi:polyhydroxyalkanoate synthesis repressor PhaR